MKGKRYASLIHRPVVTTADAMRVYGGDRRRASQMLDYLRREGTLVKVRRGLYVPGPAVNPQWEQEWDPYLVASRIQRGATLAFHSALVVHGVAQNPSETVIHVATPARFAPFSFRGIRFVNYVHAPKEAARSSISIARSGEVIRVTKPEWTLAMCARLVSRGGGFEEILQSSAGFRRIDMSELLRATQAQGGAAVFNRVGFLAWWNRRRWRVRPEELQPFRQRLSRNPAYFGVGGDPTSLVRDWNLLVPQSARALLEEDHAAD
jgi:predicted transcriptional regulator of viral defense system